jgi:hypothetical protein
MASSRNYSAVLQDSSGSNLRFVASEHQFQTWGAAQSGAAALSEILASSNQTTVMTVRGANVGIGATNPLAKLQVSGNVGIGTAYAAVSPPANGCIIAGNVGIGATNPLAKLQVSGNVGIGTAYATLASPIDGCIILGNVGIGTATPTTKLHVVGTMQATAGLTLGSATLTSPVGAMPMYACRAWVNFDGTAVGTGFNAAGNVTTVSRNSAGNYTVTFTVAMSSASYAPLITFDGNGTGVLSGAPLIVTKAVGSINFVLYRATSTSSTARQEFNSPDVTVAIFM